MRFTPPAGAPDLDAAPDATAAATAELDPARLFPGNRGGWTRDGEWAVERIYRGRVDITRRRDGAVIEYADTTVEGALRAIATGWADAELELLTARRAARLAAAS